MHLSIMLPSHRFFNGEVNSVTLPGDLGPFQVFANHAPTLSSLTAGNVTYMVGNELLSIKINSGFALIARNQVRIVCEAIIAQ